MGKRKPERGNGEGRLTLYADGAIRPAATGLGIVIRDGAGQVLAWCGKHLPQAMTCNEAEYQALLLGLETAQMLRPERLEVRMDSQIVVNQMQGLFAVRSAALRRLHARVRQAVAALGVVEFVHVRRLGNRLADALANEAAERMTDDKWERRR